MDGYGWDGMGWDLCAGLLYEHRFAMLIIIKRPENEKVMGSHRNSMGGHKRSV